VLIPLSIAAMLAKAPNRSARWNSIGRSADQRDRTPHDQAAMPVGLK